MRAAYIEAIGPPEAIKIGDLPTPDPKPWWWDIPMLRRSREGQAALSAVIAERIETHQLAARLAQGLAALPDVLLEAETVQTNIVRFRLRGIDSGRFVDELHARGVHVLPSGANGVRAVLYLDLTPEDINLALAAIGETLKALAPEAS